MRWEFMFLTVLILGDRYPGAKIDVYLHSLIDELKSLWDVGLTDTYDVANKTHFDMRAALLWTVNDFSAYGMLSAWSTHGKLSCPICMKDTKAFTLKHDGKPTFLIVTVVFLTSFILLEKTNQNSGRERLNSTHLL